MKNFLVKFNNQSGISLVETVVSLALFSVVVIGATGIFQVVINGQRSAIASQNIQENLRYVFEAFSKEVRNASKNDSGCGVAANNIYNITTDINGNDILFFKNKYGECVTYSVTNGTLMIQRGIYLASTTPPQVKINKLKFNVVDNPSGYTVATVQPMATIMVDAEIITNKTENKQRMKMQTTISSRRY